MGGKRTEMPGKETKSNGKSLNERYDDLMSRIPKSIKDLMREDEKSNRPKPRDFELLPQRKMTENPI
jgi:hypothetical protein